VAIQVLANQLRQLLLQTARLQSSLPLTPETIQNILKVSAQWLDLANQQPRIFTLLLCQPKSVNSQQGLLARQLAALIIIGLQHHENQHSLQHIIAALLSQPHLSGMAKVPTPRELQQSSQWLTRYQLSVWAQLQTASVPRYSYSQQSAANLFAIALRLAAQIHKFSNYPLASQLQTQALKVPAHIQSYLAALVEYPGIYPEGSRVNYADQDAVVIRVNEDAIGLLTPNNKLVWLAKDELSAQVIGQLSLAEWLQCYHRHEHTLNNHLAPTSTWPLHQSYPVNRPPASLQGVLNAIKHTHYDLNTIVNLIECEPAFSEFITHSASLDNRARLPVKSIRQGILTYGIERVGHMLVQHALTQRLYQHNFYLRPYCQRLTLLFCAISSELATIYPVLSPQSAALVATIMSAPLFTLSEFKTRNQLFDKGKDRFTIGSLLPAKRLASMHTTLLQLSNQWYQDPLQRQLVSLLGKLPSQVPVRLRQQHCILGVSLIWTRQWLLQTSHNCRQTLEFLHQAATILPEFHLHQSAIRDNLSDEIYCPL
jgi:hypothetical protein